MTETIASRPPSFSSVTMTQVLLPSHSSFVNANCFTGQLLKWMDVCACMAAERHSGETCVTASVDELHFHDQMDVGEIVVLLARVNCTFKSSMEVGVRVTSEDLLQGRTRHICSAYFTFVVNSKERGSLIAAVPETEDDKRRNMLAHERRHIRLMRKKLIQTCADGEHSTCSSSSPPLPSARPLAASALETTELVLPPHANHMGNLFGGQVMTWMEQAALIAATKHTRRHVIITGIDDIHFFAPAVIGDRLKILSRVNRVFGNSMEVGVRVECEKLRGGTTHLNSAYFTFEAADHSSLPIGLAESVEEQRGAHAALGRRKLRLERLAIRRATSISYPWSRDLIPSLVLDNVKLLLDLYFTESGWDIVSNQDGICMSYKLTENGAAVKIMGRFLCSVKRAYELPRDLSRRVEWDLVITGYRKLEELDENNDVIEMSFRGTPPRRFTLLRSCRHLSDGRYLITNHSITGHPSSTPDDVVQGDAPQTGELSSSGFVFQEQAAAQDGTQQLSCIATYLLQVNSGSTMKLVLADIVGQSKALVLSFAKLRSLLEEEEKKV